ncbi:hypothetical protein SDC9_180402 [bioreactor metagenome]|uniref:Uncharacterized protein n=1 Tax=bioreactor metagenome TaxID=1076179 RepID=A0A645H4G8_9ZZZZ
MKIRAKLPNFIPYCNKGLLKYGRLPIKLESILKRATVSSENSTLNPLYLATALKQKKPGIAMVKNKKSSIISLLI